MLDPNEAGFLRAIAENHEDNTVRLVYADWLEEHGEVPRADFIRIQCELAAANLSEEDRNALRLRERKLLDEHRQQWCDAVGVPIEGVHFERGLISKMRITQWEGGKLLDPECARGIETLTELDLSERQLRDDDIIEFAEKANLPALRSLFLNDNGITNAGAGALASAAGLPRLETLYLFNNQINASSRGALKRSTRFRLKNLDLGERDEGYIMSPGEAEMARRQYLRTQLVPAVWRYFDTYKLLQSAMLCVAQYWADEADDAVHDALIVSELLEPTLEGVTDGFDESYVDPNIPNTPIITYGQVPSSAVSGAGWDDNNRAIPLWAAYAPEEGSQDFSFYSDVYAPAVMFYRHGGYDILPMRRPHLSGVRPQWD